MCHTAQFRLLTKLYSNYPHEYKSVAMDLHKPIASEKYLRQRKEVVIETSLHRASYIMCNCLSKTDKNIVYAS